MKFTKNEVLLAHKNGLLGQLRKKLITSEIHKEYDSDDETAILRQATTKPAEYEAYFAYAEDCKRRVDEYINSIIMDK
jgi:hypothetical protein